MTVGNPEGVGNGRFDVERAMSVLNGLEEAVSGKPAKWAGGENNRVTSGVALAISIISSFWMVMNKHGSMTDELETKHMLFLLAFGATSFLLVWTVLLTTIKGTIIKSRSSAILGLIAAGSIFFLCDWLLGFVLVEANWGIVWSARVQLFAGHEMNYRMISDSRTASGRAEPSSTAAPFMAKISPRLDQLNMATKCAAA